MVWPHRTCGSVLIWLLVFGLVCPLMSWHGDKFHRFSVGLKSMGRDRLAYDSETILRRMILSKLVAVNYAHQNITNTRLQLCKPHGGSHAHWVIVAPRWMQNKATFPLLKVPISQLLPPYRNRRRMRSAENAPQDSGSHRCRSIPVERPSVNVAMILFACFGFGGLLVGFVPLYVCLLMPLSVHYERILIRTAWCGGCCSSSAILWLFLSGLYPYTWGLPPGWLPKTWN
jgi:hypothetical protein